MLAARLHACPRDDPDLVIEINLVPLRADNLASSGGGKDEELQRPRRGPFLTPQRCREISDLIIGSGRMVLDLLNIGARREQLVEVAPPTCRVLALLVSTDGGPIEDRFDASSKPA